MDEAGLRRTGDTDTVSNKTVNDTTFQDGERLLAKIPERAKHNLPLAHKGVLFLQNEGFTKTVQSVLSVYM